MALYVEPYGEFEGGLDGLAGALRGKAGGKDITPAFFDRWENLTPPNMCVCIYIYE